MDIVTHALTGIRTHPARVLSHETRDRQETLAKLKKFIEEQIAAWDYKLAQEDISTIDYAMYDYARKFAKEILEILE